MPVGICSSLKFVFSKPSSLSVGMVGVPGGSGAKCALSASISYAGSLAGASSVCSFLSHAFLYGVNTEKGLPASDKTSSLSKMT